jgi:hypothetical protein
MLRSIAVLSLYLTLASALHAATDTELERLKPLIKPALREMITRVSWTDYSQVDGKPVPTVIYHATAADGLSVYIAYSTVPTLSGQTHGIVASYFGKELKPGGHNVAVASDSSAAALPPYKEFAPGSLDLGAKKATAFEQLVDLLRAQRILNTVGFNLKVLDWSADRKIVTWTFRDIFRECELRDALIKSNLFQTVNLTPGVGLMVHPGFPVTFEKVFDGELP